MAGKSKRAYDQIKLLSQLSKELDLGQVFRHIF